MKARVRVHGLPGSLPMRCLLARAFNVSALSCLIWSHSSVGWAASTEMSEPAQTGAVSTDQPGEPERSWAIGTSIYGYVVPDADDYVQPTVTVDRGWLHLEARYQYEAMETGSAWVGYNLSGGGEVTWEFTPMLGGVFGETMGVVPGFRGSVAWWWLEFGSEGECVFDVGSKDDSFVYNWSELTISPVDWFRAGVAMQRTRVYRSDREVQWGPMAGFAFWHLDLSAYVFNLDDEEPTLVFAVAATF